MAASNPAVMLTVTYDDDIAAGAATLLAVLRRSEKAIEPTDASIEDRNGPDAPVASKHFRDE